MLLAGALLLSAVGCGGKRGASEGGRVGAPDLVVLGVDGFDWNLLDPLVQAGRMPVMKQLLAEGVRADLLTLVPLEKSPVIWTTIATGRLPADNERGRGFLAEAGADGAPRAFTSASRRSRAFWNILTERGASVSVLGWLETWPAEEVNGAIVTDYIQYDIAERQKLGRIEHRTHPAALESEIDSLIVRPRDVTLATLRPLLGGTFDTTRASREMHDGLDALRWIYAGDLTFTAVARHVLEKRPTRVVAVYLRGPDAVCHKFWDRREETASGAGDPELRRVLGPAIDSYYEETDRLIGRILEEIDLSRTNLLLVSDHGFQGPRISMDGSPMLGIYMHREMGTILLAGPGASGRGTIAAGARVQDVLPTMLHLLGLPVADDLDGEVALDLLGEKGGRGREIDRIATYETSERPRFAEGASDSAASEAIAERVKSLGYVR